jgi:hypothetical protein
LKGTSGQAEGKGLALALGFNPDAGQPISNVKPHFAAEGAGVELT